MVTFCQPKSLVLLLFTVNIIKADRTCLTINGKEEKLPDSRINDDYCDCLDMSDEPATNACAGRLNWAGYPTVTYGVDEDVMFQCPQQPDVKIPTSRVNDGVCDCCDGADENKNNNNKSATKCPDDCAEILAAAAKAAKALKDNFEAGLKVRQQMLEEFVKFTSETNTKMKQSSHDLTEKRKKLEETSIRLLEAKEKYLEHRVERLGIESRKAAESLSLNALSVAELETLIVYSCQLAGEMITVTDNEKTSCAPLRLAGLDVSHVWQPDTYKFTRMSDPPVLADILLHNRDAVDDDSSDAIWHQSGLSDNPKSKKKKAIKDRRLEEYDGDYDNDWEDDEYNMEMEDYEEEDYSRRHEEEEYTEEEGGDGSGEKRAELRKLVLEQKSYHARSKFLSGATSVMGLIDEIQSKEDEKDETENASTETEQDTELENEQEEVEDGESAAYDPMVLPEVRESLEEKERNILRGLDYAVSGKVLLAAVSDAYLSHPEEHKDILNRLAVGTFVYGKISSVHYYEALTATIPEIVNEFDVNTCVMNRASICPPRSTERSTNNSIPPVNILAVVERFCESVVSSDPVDDSCFASGETGKPLIPSSIPDGYNGYWDIHPREDTDILNEIFKELGHRSSGEEEVARSEVGELVEQMDSLNKKVSDLEKQMKSLEESIGKDDPDKFGPDGELHGVKDKCFDVVEGKYVYEVCPFGAASQKDKGSKSGGTNLGKWKGAVTETVTDEQGNEFEQRVWKWENGAKCWNGPKRSATAYVTCGSQTKVLSADEPDTCTYVLQMESPIACDEDFRTRKGL